MDGTGHVPWLLVKIVIEPRDPERSVQILADLPWAHLLCSVSHYRHGFDLIMPPVHPEEQLHHPTRYNADDFRRPARDEQLFVSFVGRINKPYIDPPFSILRFALWDVLRSHPNATVVGLNLHHTVAPFLPSDEEPADALPKCLKCAYHCKQCIRLSQRHVPIQHSRRLPTRAYLELTRKSLFCLVTRGDSQITGKLTEAVLGGCIPVLISDMPVWPFYQRLCYPSFSYEIHWQLALNEPHRVMEFLLSRPQHEIHAKQLALLTVRKHFEFVDSALDATSSGAVAQLVADMLTPPRAPPFWSHATLYASREHSLQPDGATVRDELLLWSEFCPSLSTPAAVYRAKNNQQQGRPLKARKATAVGPHPRRVAPPVRWSCGLDSWLALTANNSADRLVLAIDSWPGTGIGHSIPGSARWLRLLTALASTDTLNPRALRLAACAPRALREVIGDARVAMCEDPHFDLSRFLTFRGVPSLHPTEHHFQRIIGENSTIILRKPRCETLLAALRSSSPLVVVVRVHVEELKRCLEQELGRQSGEFECTPEARLTKEIERPLPTCEVGLHLRTLAVDDPNCNMLSDKVDAVGCKFQHRGKNLRCGEAFPALAEGCDSRARFATADIADAYVQTRAIGWADLNESAQRTWFGVAPADGKPLGSSYQLRDSVDTTSWASTVMAWLTLATCKKAIVAPVESRFSTAAAMSAGVPLVGCCSQLAPSTAQVVTQVAGAGGRGGLSPVARSSEFALESFDLGYCAATELGGNCKVDDSGAWSLPPRRAFNGWNEAAEWCLRLCRLCDRCTAVSISLSELDCSWFAKCPVTSLLQQRKVQGHRTFRLPQKPNSTFRLSGFVETQ